MEFKTVIRSLAEGFERILDKITTEESTKTSLVLPFLNALGYNVFDPTEVVPEFTADVGIKKGEKVDYAIFKDGVNTMIIECKPRGATLNNHESQLTRYFSVTKTRFALLTNGIEYRFYTDLENNNLMDSKPFLEFNILDMSEGQIHELNKFHKSIFDEEKIISTASSLKYVQALKKAIQNEFDDPSEELIQLFANKVYEGRLSPKIKAEFKSLTERALKQFISDKISARLNAALDTEVQIEATATEEMEEEKPRIVTTEEELEAYHIVLSICRRKVDRNRVVMRDTQSYCGVLLDDNNRKPICRLHFNGSTKYLGLFDENKLEERHKIESLDEIFNHESHLLKTLEFY
ncbi:MAG: type I restriction endonuclease [Crocinitomicaceae bacterium]|jgi:hypothetical protein|nr:type I restriction endonuclease [Crocinitomicaceae bacterium]